MRKITIILILLTLIPLYPQNYKASFFRASEINTGFVMQTWTAGDEKISEYVVPLSIVIPVSNSLVIQGSSSSAYATLTSAEDNITGFTDSRVSFSYVTLKNSLLINGAVTAPSGKTALEGDQSLIASALALYPLSFRVPSFGQGLSASISGVYAFQLGDYILGGGAGFVYKDGFKPFKNRDLKYQPGMEISVNAGGETKKLVKNMRLIADITYTYYGADKYDKKEVFKSGGKFILDLRSEMKMNKSDLVLYLRERTKGKNDRGIGTLTTEEKNSNGNQLELGSLGFFPTSESFGFKGAVEVKYYSQNGYESNGATIFGLGGGFNYRLSKSLYFDLLLKYSIGNLSNKNVSTSVSGIEAGGGIKIIL